MAKRTNDFPKKQTVISPHPHDRIGRQMHLTGPYEGRVRMSEVSTLLLRSEWVFGDLGGVQCRSKKTALEAVLRPPGPFSTFLNFSVFHLRLVFKNRCPQGQGASIPPRHHPSLGSSESCSGLRMASHPCRSCFTIHGESSRGTAI